jgi:hypothetical protein
MPGTIDIVMECVRALLVRGVTRLDQIEVMIAMMGEPGRTSTAGSVAEGALLSDERVADALDGLERLGLVRGVPCEPGEPRFELSPDLDHAGLRVLRVVHAADRTRIANPFFACRLEALRDLASSLRRGRPE